MMKDTGIVTQLPPDGWFEGFAVRRNGNILAGRVDKAEVYTLDPRDEDAEPKLLYTFPSSVPTGIMGMCNVPGPGDQFILITAMVDFVAIKAQKFTVWRLDLSKGDKHPPQLTKVAPIPDGDMITGLVVALERILLFCDCAKNRIFRLDMTTGYISTLVESGLFGTSSTENPVGINRMRIVKDHLWFTNCNRGLLGRIRLKFEGDHVDTAGDIEIIASDMPQLDGLAVLPDGSAAYTAAMLDGQLWEVLVNAGGKPSTSVVMEDLTNPSGVEIVHVDGRPKLYIMNSGEIKVSWRHLIDHGWSDIAAINGSVSVTVTTETAEENRADDTTNKLAAMSLK